MQLSKRHLPVGTEPWFTVTRIYSGVYTPNGDKCGMTYGSLIISTIHPNKYDTIITDRR